MLNYFRNGENGGNMKPIDLIIVSLTRKLFTIKKYPINSLTLLSGIFFLLIPLLAYYQYQWLGKLSEGEKDRLKNTLKFSSQQFIKEFDSQLSELYQHFDTSGLRKNNGAEVTAEQIHKSLIDFRDRSNHPSLIESVSYLTIDKKNQDYEYWEFDDTTISLISKSWPDYLSHLHGMIKPKTHKDEIYKFKIIQGLQFENVPFFVIPIISTEQNFTLTKDKLFSAPKYLIIKLNYEVLKNDILPTLYNSYYKTNDDLNYNLTIFNKETNQILFSSDPVNSDTVNLTFDYESPIGNMKSSNFVFNHLIGERTPETVKKEITSKLKSEKSNVAGSYVFSTTTSDDLPVTVINQEKSGNSFSSSYQTNNRVKVQLNSLVKEKADDFAQSIQIFSIVNNEISIEHNSASWMLGIQHFDGSLDSAVSNARTRNIIISFTVLALLGFTLLFAIIAVSRSQKLASQQMEFVATVSHELRTPLAVIRSAAENLTDGIVVGAEQNKKYGNLILDNGRRLSDMVEQVLEFSGIQSQNKKCNFQLTETVKYFSDIIQDFQSNNYNADLQLDIKISTTLPAAEIDRLAIKSVCVNLLQNAVKYSNPPKHIFFEVNHHTNEIYVVVKDNGIGIDEKDIPDLFQPFFRGKNATELQIKGTGLGLSLVKSIVNAHRGKIELKSKLNSGTEIKVTLPVRRNE